jgi:Spy/CpxP family protein refolding chaperone
MKHSLLNATAVAALATAMAFGQNAPPAHQGRGGQGAMMGRFGADLNLTDAQKQQAQSIFSASRESARSLNTQLKQGRDALAAAVKSGASDAEIEKLSNNLAPLLAQSTANHAKTLAKFYSILTQDQKDKVGDRFNGMMFGMQGGGGRGQGGQGRSRQQAN